MYTVYTCKGKDNSNIYHKRKCKIKNKSNGSTFNGIYIYICHPILERNL